MDISKWSNISKSLFLPLFFRAFDHEKKDSLLRDSKAFEIVERLPLNREIVRNFKIVEAATILRDLAFDELLRDFLSKNPEGTIINIGSGLDTRFFRIDNGLLNWFEIDLPEIIETRREFFKETKRYRFISGCAFNLEWGKIFGNKKRPVLILIQGVLFYHSKEKVKKLIKELKKNFPGAELIFDAVSPFQAMLSPFNPALRLMNLKFKWGLLSPREINLWDFDIETSEVIYYFKPSIKRFGWHSWISIWPGVGSGFYIVPCRLGKNLD